MIGAVERTQPVWRRVVGEHINPWVLGLLYFTGLGVVVGLWRFLTGLGATTGLTDTYAWGIWIGFDFTLIAFSGAGFTMAGLVYILRQEQYRPALRPAVLTALLGYTAVLVLLVLDLGRPDRFYNFILFYNMHSPLFEICWCVLLYTTVLVVEVSPQLLERINQHRLAHFVHRIIVPFAIAAVTLSTLHQSTLGTLYLNMPYRLHALWYTPFLPVLFLTSSVFTGFSVAVVAYRLAAQFARVPVKGAVAAGLGRLVAWIAGLYLVLKIGELVVSNEIGLLFSSGSRSVLFIVELLLVGGAIAYLTAPATRNSARGQFYGAGLAMLSTLMNRFDATLFGQITANGGTYSPQPGEWLTTFGVLAGVALAWYLGVRLLAVFESRMPHTH